MRGDGIIGLPSDRAESVRAGPTSLSPIRPLGMSAETRRKMTVRSTRVLAIVLRGMWQHNHTLGKHASPPLRTHYGRADTRTRGG